MPYLPVLDIIRFVAAMLVVLFHTSWQNSLPAFRADFGWVGVEIFFVVSGFVISRSARSATPKSFVYSRISRLYPAAFCCLTLDYAVLCYFGGAPASLVGIDIWANRQAFLTSLTLVGTPRLFTALWTLPVELAFYALVLILILRSKTDQIEKLAYGLIVVSIPYLTAYFLWMIHVSPTAVPPLGYDYLNMTFIRHGCFFGLGILLFLSTERNTAAYSQSASLRYGMIALALMLGVMEISSRALEIEAHFKGEAIFGLSVVAAFVFLIGTAAIWASSQFRDRVPCGPRTSALLRLIGLMSYPIYLTHEVIDGTAIGLFIGKGFDPVSAQFIGIAYTLLISLVIARYLEPLVRSIPTRAFAFTSACSPNEPPLSNRDFPNPHRIEPAAPIR